MSNVHIREALEKLGKDFAAQPEKARAKNPPATARLREGLACEVVGSKGTVHTDMPSAVGGEAKAPTPSWYLRASFASCEATVIAMRAAKLGIVLKNLEVTVESESDTRGMIGVDDKVSPALLAFKTHVKISADGATPAQLREIVAWAEAHSPVGCTLREHSEVHIEIG